MNCGGCHIKRPSFLFFNELKNFRDCYFCVKEGGGFSKLNFRSKLKTFFVWPKKKNKKLRNDPIFNKNFSGLITNFSLLSHITYATARKETSFTILFRLWLQFFRFFQRD